MNKILVSAIALALPAVASAQSAVDAYTLSQTEMRGTARFMSMGGAFTALGGDLSAVSLNPAGIGVYRSSEIGATLDVSFNSFKTLDFKQNQTKAACNNFGYVGVARLDGAMRTFAWGASYNRTASFNRLTHGYSPSLDTSLSNYVAATTTADGTYAGDMDFTDTYNPYVDSDIQWLSILAYSGYMINPYNSAANRYQGLYQDGTKADAYYTARERGYVDEYDLSFGGNISDVVYWGLNVGITDLSYSRDVVYDESLGNAAIANYRGRLVTGDAGFTLYNSQHVSGNGWNFNFGLIVKPVNELRIGFSIKTPTWWSLQHAYVADLDYSYYDPALPESTDKETMNPMQGSDYTDQANFDSRLKSPWRLNFGVAGVIGSSAIISLDYEHLAYGDMTMKHQTGYYGNSFEDATYVNQDIKDYFQSANAIRLGIEYRVTPSFSLRAGYAWQSSAVKAEAENGDLQIYTAGTDPSYIFSKSTNQVSIGAGYRYKGWYIDAAYVYKKRDSSYHCFTDFDGYRAPAGSLDEHSNSLVISTGFRF